MACSDQALKLYSIINATNTDCITLGIVPWFETDGTGAGSMTDGTVSRNCGRVLLQYKIEATYVHTDPTRVGDGRFPEGGADGEGDDMTQDVVAQCGGVSRNIPGAKNIAPLDYVSPVHFKFHFNYIILHSI